MKNESESFALYVGVDVSMSQLDIYVMDSKKRLAIANSEDAIGKSLIPKLKSKPGLLVVLDATGGGGATRPISCALSNTEVNGASREEDRRCAGCS